MPSPAERARCADWLDDELRIIRPALVVPVGRLAIDRFLGAKPLDAVVGREHEIEGAWGRVRRHPAAASERREQLGASAGNRALLERALDLIGARLGTAPAGARSVA